MATITKNTKGPATLATAALEVPDPPPAFREPA